MKSYEALEQEFKQKVEKLQNRCKHEIVSDWTEEWWAVGHSTGMMVKQCSLCKKIVDRTKLSRDLCPSLTEQLRNMEEK